MRIAEEGIDELQQHVDTLLIIPNQNLFRLADENTTFADAFAMADQVLHAGVRGITDLMIVPGLINLDFADVRAVMSEMGKAMMGTGEASGDERASAAALAAISNPLLDETSMKGAKGVLINITGGLDMKLFEVDEAANRIRSEVDPEANIIVGSTFSQELEGVMRVSVVATGIERTADQPARPTAIPPRPTTPTPRPTSEKRAETIDPVHVATASAPTTDETIVFDVEPPAPKPVMRPVEPPKAPPAPAAVAPAAHEPKPMPPVAPAAAAAPVHAPLPPQPSIDPALGAAQQAAAALKQEAQENPIGDVHDRIRRMLTEDNAVALRKDAPQPAKKANPFRLERVAQPIEAAMGILRETFSRGEASQTQAQAPSAPASRNAFAEDDPDDLEIPAFLRRSTRPELAGAVIQKLVG